MKKILLVALLAFSFWGCEKDDICDPATPTTPRLIIQFYDAANPTVLKTTTNLRIAAPGFGPINFPGAVSKIQLPLKITQDTTTFNFILNGADTDTANDNTDVIQINYSRNTVFVSRACGYKTTFTLNNPNGFILTDNPVPDTFWIQSTTQVTSNIETENEIHVKLFI